MYETWAQIKDGVVVNTVRLSDSDFKDPNYIWVKIENLNPTPGNGWLYNSDNTFSNPYVAPSVDPATYIQGVIASAQEFGALLMQKFGAENVLSGFTQQQMDTCLTTLDPVLNAINSGSLKIAISRMNALQLDGVVLTTARIKKYRNMIEDYLGIPQT